MFTLMIFMFCFLLASLVMFLYMLNKLDNHFRTLNDEHAQLRVLLRALESRLDHMEKYMCATGADQTENALSCEAEKQVCEDEEAVKATPSHDPLLHLSFEGPGDMETDKMRPELDLLLDDGDTEKRS